MDLITILQGIVTSTESLVYFERIRSYTTAFILLYLLCFSIVSMTSYIDYVNYLKKSRAFIAFNVFFIALFFTAVGITFFINENYGDKLTFRNEAIRTIEFIDENKEYNAQLQGTSENKPVECTLNSSRKIDGIPIKSKSHSFKLSWEHAVQFVKSNPQITMAMNP